MTQKQSARDEAIARLRETLKPGDTVFTVLRSVSRSGMSRNIDLYKLEGGDRIWLSHLAARACDWSFNEKHECVRVGGCGMDMGFHLVYNLARTLFCDAFTCIGDHCPSNDHNNAYYRMQDKKCVVCGQALGGKSKEVRPSPPRDYPVCSTACATGAWLHSDAGYALNHRWL